MLVSQIGEFGLIKRLRQAIKTDSSVIKGSGDDCAVLAFTKHKYLLFTCDVIAEGVDFAASDNPFLIGRKALAVSISDIAACAGIPRYCLVSMCMPKNTNVNRIEEIFKGMSSLAKEYKINIVGGDVSRAKHLIIDISLLGVVEKKNLVLRNGAQVKDIIFVTGKLGGSIYGKHLKFTPRIREARFLANNFKPNSLIDISDGLAQDLNHILEESKVGAVIYEGLIPISPKANGLKDALYSGEDFELLFTLSLKEAKKLLAKKLANFKPIGEIREVKYGLRLIDKKGKEKIIFPRGFKHF